MQELKIKPLIFFILGPTGAGKSDLALRAAEELNSGGVQSEIINADSIQVYKELDIGSAKPTVQELQRVPHHLISHIPLGETYTAGKFRKDVLDVLEKRTQSGVQVFFIVGGSGFYLKALIHGLYEIPEVSADIQKSVAEASIQDLYEELKNADPEVAKKLSPNDTYRVSRAVEVFRATGVRFSDYEKKFELKKLPYKYFKIGLATTKDVLRERIETRANKMIENGLLNETRQLMNQGFSHWAPLNSVGYKESQMFIRGEIADEKLLPLLVTSTMQLVKKQMTWFKKDSEIEWFDIQGGLEKPLMYIKERV